MESAQKRRARSLDLALLSLARQNSNTVQILSEDMTIPQSSLIGPTALCFVLLLGISNAQPRSAPPMKVKLSVSTFDPASLREFQSLADEISAIIDEMIPGVPADYPADGIVCLKLLPDGLLTPTKQTDFRHHLSRSLDQRYTTSQRTSLGEG